MERCETLDGTLWHFFYDDALFPPGTDSFLLSSFPRLKPGQRVCDLGCGSGLLGLLLLRRQPEVEVLGIDCCENALKLGQRTAAENRLEDRLRFHRADLRNQKELTGAGSFDLVICNPPYFPAGSGIPAAAAARQAARSEESCTLAELCRSASHLLRWGGSFCLVHKPDRLADLCTAMREAGVELKRLRPVVPRAETSPSLLLAEGRRGGHPGVIWEPPLILQESNGQPTPEASSIYYQKKERAK